MNWKRGPWWVLGLVALLAVLLYRPALSPAWVLGGVAAVLLGVGLIAGYRHGMPMNSANLRAQARFGFLSVFGVAAAALIGNLVGTGTGSGWIGVAAGMAIFVAYNVALFTVLLRIQRRRSETMPETSRVIDIDDE
jgi:hypothetical protein